MVNVLLCSDKPVLSAGLSHVLARTQELKLCAYCGDTEQIQLQLGAAQPDILLIELNEAVSINSLKALQEYPSPSKIVLWVHSISTELALQAMSLGVRGILRKQVPFETLIRCLMRVHEGEFWFEKALTDSFVKAKRYTLTRREGQLVSLLSHGLKNKEIAATLNISEGTVKVYLSRLFQKLDVKDRFELALFGLKNLTYGSGSTLDAPRQAGKPINSPVWQPRSFFVERQPVHA